MARRFGLISVDDHVQEHPRVWLDRLSLSKWGDRIPQIDDRGGPERWLIDGVPARLDGVGIDGVLSADHSEELCCWEDVPSAAYRPADRLRAMDSDGVDYSVLYPTVAGVGGEN